MKLAPLLILLAGCQADESSHVDAGDDPSTFDDRPWTGTASLAIVDFSGNTDTITVDATWTPTAHDETGIDYAASGTVSITREIPGCTVTIDPDSAAIGDEDGYLRVDDDGTYRGFAGTFWSVTHTIQCPPNPPQSLPSMVANQWLNTPTSRPMTGDDEIAGDETVGAYHYTWTFSR